MAGVGLLVDVAQFQRIVSTKNTVNLVDGDSDIMTI